MPRLCFPSVPLCCSCLLLAAPATFGAGKLVEPTPEEHQGLESIRGTEGVIVWHSNRDGDFEIFRMNADGTDKRQLTHNDRDDHFARWSPDGRLIAFTSERNIKSQVFLMDADGSNQRMIIDDGEMCSWLPDGRGIVWQRKDLSRVLVRDFATGTDREILPGKVPELQGKRVGYASFSSDLRHVTFYSNWRGYHSANLIDADWTGLRMVGKGCEPSWFPDGTHVVHVKAGARIYRNNLKCNDYRPVTDIPRGKGRRDHEYFPSISNDGRYLVWGICPWNQHNHMTSDYEIFVMRLPDGKATRLTFHSATDAWPHMFRQVKPPAAWEGLETEPDWEVIPWADPVEMGRETLKREGEGDGVIRLTAKAPGEAAATGKCAVGMDIRRDLSVTKAVEIEAENAVGAGVSLAVAFRTGPDSIYFESGQAVLSKGRSTVSIPVNPGRFKCEASGWKFVNEPPAGLEDARKFIVLVYGFAEGRSVTLRSIHLR